MTCLRNASYIAVLAIVCVPVLAAPPSAYSATGISGVSPNTCTLGTPTVKSQSDADLVSATPSSATVVFTNFVDPATAKLIDTGPGIVLQLAAMCNYKSQFNMKSQNGQLATTMPIISGSFVRTLNYTATFTWGKKFSTMTTTGTAGQKSPVKAIAGAYSGEAELEVMVSTSAGPTLPLVAGDFADQLTFQIGASL